RGGGIVGNTAKQRVSKAYSVLMRLAGGPPIHDVSNAFKAYRRSVVASVPTVADSFDIPVELTVRAALAGSRAGEGPSVWTSPAFESWASTSTPLAGTPASWGSSPSTGPVATSHFGRWSKRGGWPCTATPATCSRWPTRSFCAWAHRWERTSGRTTGSSSRRL